MPRPVRPRLLPASLIALLVVALGSCASNGTAAENPGITVFADSSLSPVFTEMGADYTRETGVPVRFTFAGSTDLVDQLAGGTPADVLATANEASMTLAEDADVIEGDRTLFASNTLVIAVQPGNPLGITGIPDLGRPETTLVLCAPRVPCGSATARVLKRAAVEVNPVSEEDSDTAVLDKITSGEADAGLVYTTDVIRSGGKAEAVEFPEAADVVSLYPVARVAGSTQAPAAQEFVAWLAGPEAGECLAEAGFGPP